jgi:elongation factor Ts
LSYVNVIVSQIAQQSGKPANMIERMVDGKMKKFFEENVLLEQKSVVEEGSPKIGEWLKGVAKKHNLGEVKVVSFARMKVGEKTQQQQQQQTQQQ